MKVLVLNCGSSTLKFQVIEVIASRSPGRREQSLARGLIDRLGDHAVCTFALAGSLPGRETIPIPDQEEAVRQVFLWLERNPAVAPRELGAVGHRVVHGGDRFRSSVLIDDRVLTAIEACNDLAPLHNPQSVSGIRTARKILGPAIPMAAVFDTSFHHTLPEYASTYAIPYELSLRHRIRRYGFHGLAHRYLSLRYGEVTQRPVEQTKIITLHLGNGCSVTAMRSGRSLETSMGFTPLEGLVMGTRSGDLDPAVVSYLARKEGLSLGEVEALLNERSGLLGISGLSGDMRELFDRSRSDARARLAVEIFCYRARKYLGAYLAVLGGADAVIFSGGIGENAPGVRAQICEGMEWCGLRLDPELNGRVIGTEGRISSAEARLEAFVMPVDEERVIALETASLLAK